VSDRNIAKRLAGLERHMDALEAREATFPEHREMSEEEKIEVGLIMLAYVHEGDERAFAEHLKEDFGASLEEAAKFASWVGSILEERSAVAEDPRHPV
jgi:hypothetical protein